MLNKLLCWLFGHKIVKVHAVHGGTYIGCERCLWFPELIGRE